MAHDFDDDAKKELARQERAQLKRPILQLIQHGGYGWLLQGKAFWSVSEVVRALAEEGVKISNDTVARWFKTLPHTQDFGGPVGLRASRNDLIIMFATEMISRLADKPTPDPTQSSVDTSVGLSDDSPYSDPAYRNVVK